MKVDSREHSRNLLSRREFLRLAGIVGAGISTGVVGACGRQNSPALQQAQQASGSLPVTPKGPVGDMVILQGVDLDNLDPYGNTTTAADSVIVSMYDRLTEYNPDMKVIPWLATSWATVNDRTWRLELRKGVTFHNGERFDARSVKASISRFVDPATKNSFANNLKPVENVEIIDDYTVNIHTKEPFPDLMEVFARFCPMIPPSGYQGRLDLSKTPVGTGAYKFKEWRPGERLVVSAAGPHFSGQPKMATVIWKVVPDAFTRIAELKAGTADLITGVDPRQASEIESVGGKVVAVTEVGTHFIGLNFARKPFQDKRVRQALNLAVDKKAIIESVLLGRATQVAGPYGPGTLAWDATLQPYEYNPARARQLLEEAGYADGFDVAIASPNGRYFNDTKVCEAIAGQWAKVGVRATVKVLEWGVFIKGMTEKRHDCFLVRHSGLPESNNLKAAIAPKYKGHAWQGWENRQVDDLADRAVRAMDRDERQKIYREIARITFEEAPWVFLWNMQALYGVSKRVQNWRAMPNDSINLGEASLRV